MKVLWALAGAFLVETAWWVLNRDRNAWTRACPSRAYYNRDEYWGDL